MRTLIWAALHGEDAQLASVIGLSNETREQARTLIARLPPDAQAAWTPERLAALFFTGFLSEVSAATAEPVMHTDATHATMLVRFTGAAKEAQFPLAMMQENSTWRILVPDQAIRSLEARLRAQSGASSSPPPPQP